MFVAAVVMVMVLYPLLAVLYRSLVVSPEDPVFTLRWYQQTFSDPRAWAVIRNTGRVVLLAVPLSAVLGTTLAVLVARIRLPISTAVISVLPIISLFIPPLLGAMGWVFLLAPRTGLINVALRYILSWPEPTGPLSIYSVTGVVLTSTIYLAPYTYLLALSALQNMDPALEEASRVSGARFGRTSLRVTLPLIAPALFSGLLLASMMALAEFSIPLIIGAPFGFEVITLFIWRKINAFSPPQYGAATAIGVLMLVVAMLGIYLQGFLIKQGRYTVIGGKGVRTSKVDLGRWSWAAAAFLLAYVFIAVVLPVLGILYVSVLRFWTASFRPSLLTLDNFSLVLSGSQNYLLALRTSTFLGTFGATIGILLSTMIAYIVLRTNVRGRRTLEYVAMLPSGLPHVLLGLGFLLLFIQLPVKIYGTTLSLLLAYVFVLLPQGTQSAVSSLHQLHRELEEASAVSGASWGRTFRKISLPLLAPGLWGGWTMLFVLMFRELSVSVLLSTSRMTVVSTRIVEVWENGTFPTLAAFSLIILVVNVSIVMIARRLSRGRRQADEQN